MISTSEFNVIAALDLDPIKVKLMHEESGEGWSLAYANEVEFEYRRFLYLMKKYPDERTAPLFDVDIFWHYHILDTMKYAADCEAVFGYFLHHFPYIGLRGEEDLEAHDRIGERMRELYEQTFGEGYIRRERTADSDAIANVAFSAATGKIAFSAATSKVAFSGATNQVAFSAATSKVAFSGVSSKVAFSGATAKFAFSGAPGNPASTRATVHTAFASPPGRAADALFFSTRPSLACAA